MVKSLLVLRGLCFCFYVGVWGLRCGAWIYWLVFLCLFWWHVLDLFVGWIGICELGALVVLIL